MILLIFFWKDLQIIHLIEQDKIESWEQKKLIELDVIIMNILWLVDILDQNQGHQLSYDTPVLVDYQLSNFYLSLDVFLF